MRKSANDLFQNVFGNHPPTGLGHIGHSGKGCSGCVCARFNGENYNLGFVNQLDLPYPELVAAARATHRRIYQVHSGALPPTSQKAKVR